MRYIDGWALCFVGIPAVVPRIVISILDIRALKELTQNKAICNKKEINFSLIFEMLAKKIFF